MQKNLKIEISHRTVIFTIFFLLLLKLLWEVHDLIFSLFIALIVMSALKPTVSFLEKKRIPKALSTIIIFVVAIFILVYAVTWIFPPIIVEITQLFRQLPAVIEKLNPALSDNLKFDNFNQYLPNVANNLFSVLGGIFSNVVFVVSTIFFSFYFIMEEGFIKKFLSRFFAEKNVLRFSQVFERIEQRMSNWFWGQITLMTIIGVMTFVGLNLIGMKYALPLAIIAALLEAVPNVGPIISAIPALILGFGQSSFLGLSVVALYFIIQQFENNLIVPLVMRRMVGLNPILTLIALIVGGRIGGVLGVLLAIPVTLFIETIILESSRAQQS